MAITIRPYSPGDLSGVTGVLNTVRPDLPLVTTDMLGHRLALDDREPRYRGERFVATQAGAVVGYMAIWLNWELGRPDLFQAQLAVDASVRRAGTGSRLFDLMVLRARDLGAQRIDGQVSEADPASIAFLERRGCLPSGHREQYSRLDVRHADFDRFLPVAERMERSGIRIVTLAEFGTDPESLRAVRDMETQPFRDMPLSDAIMETMPLDAWIERWIQSPGSSAETFWVAVDGGQPVGLTSLARSSDSVAITGFTGVARNYRGRGIAHTLKLRSTEWACEHGIERVYTNNDSQNSAMLAINASMGFHPLPSSIDMQLTLAGLAPVSIRREILELNGHTNGSR